MPEKPHAKYVGDGAFVAGVPARDLTEEEWETLPEKLRKWAETAGTHEVTAGARKSPAKPKDGDK